MTITPTVPGDHLTVPRDQLALLGVVERLVSEYDGVLPAGTVMRSVIHCREDLDECGFTGLAAAVEDLARRRLAAVVVREGRRSDQA